MKRLLTESLVKWKNSPRRKPMLLLGARQVGKTWLMLDFGKQHYKQVAYVRFDRHECMR
ncbi:MAG: AAA family ATPase, partial [Akkermansia sp.]|nr:AAA family ATPase [Akkermansia sp.]